MKKHFKEYEELCFTDDYMFCMILTTRLDLCKELLELILDIKIRKVEIAEQQKNVDITYDGKGVRFDVYVDDAETLFMILKCRRQDRKTCLNEPDIIRE